jgi:hypothetical protein
MAASGALHLTFLAVVYEFPKQEPAAPSSVPRKIATANRRAAFAGNVIPIVHTAPAFNPMALSEQPNDKTA